ncbi:hypothetical protein NMY22_g11851 [Coprinellus aureogranulatus]|nr:hypothetical protein NMY22_g11851 [Coprinellus aureogranulatus]
MSSPCLPGPIAPPRPRSIYSRPIDVAASSCTMLRRAPQVDEPFCHHFHLSTPSGFAVLANASIILGWAGCQPHSVGRLLIILHPPCPCRQASTPPNPDFNIAKRGESLGRDRGNEGATLDAHADMNPYDRFILQFPSIGRHCPVSIGAHLVRFAAMSHLSPTEDGDGPQSTVDGSTTKRIIDYKRKEEWEADPEGFLQKSYKRFCSVLMMATFTAGIQLAALSFVNDIAKIQAPLPAETAELRWVNRWQHEYTAVSFGTMLGLFAATLSSGCAGLASINAGVMSYYCMHPPSTRVRSCPSSSELADDGQTPTLIPNLHLFPSFLPSPSGCPPCLPRHAGDPAQISWVLETGALTPDSQLPSWVFTSELVVKPDHLLKRCEKAVLLALNETWDEAKAWIASKAGKPPKVSRTDYRHPEQLHRRALPAPPANTEYYVCITSQRERDSILFAHEGGVDKGDVDAKALVLDIPVTEPFPSREAIAQALLTHVPEKKETPIDLRSPL